MTILQWDASALVKQYAAEIGSATVNALFALIPPAQMVTTVLGCAETHAILVRKHNQGIISTPTFVVAASLLQNEVIYSADFGVLPLEFNAVLGGIDLITRHNINSADAATLEVYLRYALAVSDTCILVASDRRLLRAAAAEGLQTLNPELVPAADVPAFLGAL